MAFVPSPQQTALFDWIRNGSGNAFVEAVAGSGKTTSLIEGCKLMNGYVSFAAYNKAIADEINERISKIGLSNKVRAGTFHSFGYGAWRRVAPNVKIDARAKADKVATVLNIPDTLSQAVNNTVSYAKQRAMSPAQASNQSLWYDIIEHFDIENDLDGDYTVEQLINYCQKALKVHFDLRFELIDFDDMIWLPVVTGTKMWENDWLLIDEAQDTNPARRALARKMLKKGGRAVFVGDRFQAIYGFTGADSDSVDQIVRDFNCKQLPLTVTYRCPKTVVTEAQRVVSHITAHDSAPTGSVTTIKFDQEFLNRKFEPTDAILCRNTKPLITLAYMLIRKGIACHVEGRDIGKGLLQLVQKWKVKNVDTYLERLDKFVETQTEKMISKGKELQAEALKDKADSIRVLCEGCQTLNQVVEKINSLFEDSNGQKSKNLTLCTCHRSKGREWNRVYLLGENVYMPSKYARSQWQIEQENNLLYVAITRAKNELIKVELEGKGL